MADKPEPMDTDKVLEQLNLGLELQLRSLMEHIIMRKQNQIDWLRRAQRKP